MSPLQLHAPNEKLFYSRNDPDDPRLGELVVRPEGEAYEIPRSAHVVILGVPQDVGVKRNLGRAGASGGPEAIRTALYRLAAYDAERKRSIPKGFICDLGDIDCSGELEDIHDRLTEVVAEIVRQKRVPIVIGGGHDITYGAFCGVHQVHGRLGAFNFDAHLDVRPPSASRNSGTSFRMLIDEGKIDTGRCVQFGIQPFANAAAHAEWFEGRGGRIRTLETIRRVGVRSSLDATLRVARAGRLPYYGTLDLDAVRAAEAPGVSAPMPDGFEAADLMATARALGADPWCVALDVAEMNPEYDRDGITARLAAHAIARFVSEVVGR